MTTTLTSFEGYLDRVEREGHTLIARFVAGGFDPSPTSAPVLLVTVDAPAKLEAVLAELRRLEECGDGAYVCLVSTTEVHLQTDHGDELTIRAERISATGAPYGSDDFERLARLNYDWGQSQCRSLETQRKRLGRVRELIQQQHSRTLIKAERHEPGSTARTLYEQQLSFLARLLDETKT